MVIKPSNFGQSHPTPVLLNHHSEVKVGMTVDSHTHYAKYLKIGRVALHYNINILGPSESWSLPEILETAIDLAKDVVHRENREDEPPKTPVYHSRPQILPTHRSTLSRTFSRATHGRAASP